MNFLFYIIESSVCVAMLWIAYHFLLRNELFFTVNRCLLLGFIPFSFTVPMLKLPLLPSVSGISMTVNSVEIVQTNTQTPKLLSHLGRVGNNLNQIAIRVNKAGSIRLNMREFRIIEEMRNLLKEISQKVV